MRNINQQPGEGKDLIVLDALQSTFTIITIVSISYYLTSKGWFNQDTANRKVPTGSFNGFFNIMPCRASGSDEKSVYNRGRNARHDSSCHSCPNLWSRSQICNSGGGSYNNTWYGFYPHIHAFVRWYIKEDLA